MLGRGFQVLFHFVFTVGVPGGPRVLGGHLIDHGVGAVTETGVAPALTVSWRGNETDNGRRGKSRTRIGTVQKEIKTVTGGRGWTRTDGAPEALTVSWISGGAGAKTSSEAVVAAAIGRLTVKIESGRWRTTEPEGRTGPARGRDLKRDGPKESQKTGSMTKGTGRSAQ